MNSRIAHVCKILFLALILGGLVRTAPASGIQGPLFFIQLSSDPACAAGQYFVWANTTTKLVKKCEDGIIAAIGSASIGGGIPGGTANSVLFLGAGGILAQDNANFSYDSVTHRLTLSNAAIDDNVPSSLLLIADSDGHINKNVNLRFAGEGLCLGGLGVACTALGGLDWRGQGGLVVFDNVNLGPSQGTDLSFMQNNGSTQNATYHAGTMVTGWNYLAGPGERDFIHNRWLGSDGGYAFFDYSNTGVMNRLARFRGNNNFEFAGTFTLHDPTNLSAESFNETTFATHAKWGVSGGWDAAFTGNTANYSATAGNLTQTAANMAVAGVANAWYSFSYTVATSSPQSTIRADLTTAFAAASENLDLAAGSHTIYFLSAAGAATGTFTIAATGTGSFSLTAVSLKQNGPGRILTNAGATLVAFDAVGGKVGIGTVAPESLLTVNNPGIATNLTDGAFLSNSTASTAGVPVQYSPSFHWQSRVWNTTATAADNFAEWITLAVPTSGTSPSSCLSFRSSLSTTSTPSYTERFKVCDTGILTATGFTGTFNGTLGVFASPGFTATATNQLGIDSTAGEIVGWDPSDSTSQPYLQTRKVGAQQVSAGITTCTATPCSTTGYTARTLTGTANEVTVTNGDGVSGNPTISLAANAKISGFGASFSGGGSALTACATLATCTPGTQVIYTTVPFACTINTYNITVDAGTISFDVWRKATGTAIPTQADATIVGTTNWFQLTTGTALHSANPANLASTAIAANDIIGIAIQAVATAKFANIVIECDRT